MNIQTPQQLVKKALRRVIPAQVRARLKPYQAEVHRWEAEYASGRWDYLANIEELARYSVVVGYGSFFRPHGAILDVGCGTGILMHRLRSVGYATYLGVDLSQNAIERAKVHQDEITRFEVADAETFQPSESFDVIIFNEVLYYLPDPRGIWLRYAKYLRSEGIVIASIYRTPNSLQVWRLLEGVAPIRDAVSVTNHHATWDIKVYAGPATG